jgi:hypothetical protein
MNSRLQEHDDWVTVKGSSRKIKSFRPRAETATCRAREHADSDAHAQCVFDKIIQCIRSIQAYQELTNIQTKVFHLDKLISIIQTIVADEREKLQGAAVLDQIVCYGIGNFYEGSYTSPPMVQLACVLLLRRALSCPDPVDSNMSPEDFARDQSHLQMLYFEPNLHPIEERVLTKYLHMNIITNNEKGKRAINQQPNANSPLVLFYMPHCPMRLYSNLLWANWNLIGRGCLIIFGNSFKIYDNRIVDSRIRKDPTNCIFPILPFIVEENVMETATRRNSHELYVDGLQECFLELAFNDCSVMYFRIGVDSLPERPEEFLDHEDELL